MDNLPVYIRFPLNVLLLAVMFSLTGTLLGLYGKFIYSLGFGWGSSVLIVTVLSLIFASSYEEERAKKNKRVL